LVLEVREVNMIKSFNGKTPKVARSSFISEAAYLAGDIEIGEYCGIWPGVVIRGDFAPIKIGHDTDIEDNSVLHTATPLEIGDNVLIGHSVVIHGQKIGNNTLIGNNATILDEAEVGDNCIIAAGCVVTERMKIPDRSFVAGIPAEIKYEITAAQMARLDKHDMYYSRETRKLYKEQRL
jgi:carbonic anhydrase/acetyltransferase-like protein (isoleucine patch superfamily)